jgi:DNA-binding NarL/FixJ family response regulator
MSHERYGVAACDDEARMIYLSHTVGGFGGPRSVLGNHFWMQSLDEQRIRDAFIECVGDRTVVDCQSRTRTPDGSVHDYHYSLHPMPEGVAVVSVWHPPLSGEPLDSRELDVLRLLANGSQQEEVGPTLKMSARTVANVLKGCRIKLNARTTYHAVALAVRHGLV